jgi:hypothetical protein
MRPQTWIDLFFRRRQCLKTTWTFRVVFVLLATFILLSTRSLWAPPFARALTCQERLTPADAILIDNFGQDYLLFERAAALHNARYGSRVLVPTFSSTDPEASTLEKCIADVMIRIAHLKSAETIPVGQRLEPISLNVAYQIREYLRAEHIRSVLVVTSGFRARRAVLIYETILGEAGVAVSCVPVFGTTTPENWTRTWHGVQEVALEFLKLNYYRIYVLPFARHAAQG